MSTGTFSPNQVTLSASDKWAHDKSCGDRSAGRWKPTVEVFTGRAAPERIFRGEPGRGLRPPHRSSTHSPQNCGDRLLESGKPFSVVCEELLDATLSKLRRGRLSATRRSLVLARRQGLS